MHANVFRLEKDGWGEYGIVHGISRGGLRVAPEDGRDVFLSFMRNQSDGSMPRLDGPKLVEGAPCHNLTGLPAIKGRGKWKGALLRISTFNLRFAEKGSSYFGPISNGWAGAEIIDGAFIQIGARNDVDQHQLVAIEDGTSIVVADRHHRYMEIWVDYGELQGGPAAKELLGSVLVARLDKNLQRARHEALMWTRHTLDQIGLLSIWPERFEKRRRALEAA
ncbi:hypothetical protein A2704_03245 [Candidatus Kaiserbacteria bacterium RIFCSPHIGHO2_01_FULL_54_36b]|uniref:Uncharacterized protein n=1 Tax=Candidatus Kaiserbacteria bacterium RIFCSPHIGHO2_01_FULL_54_36b TaxID=1798483 RepID=A0A1F6CHK3_9BACT|nr:MAG: hypothetical protein A2704_03245 [Candidatus Kaiserbacteria bacterium RIFCSPHIGHO2_01_FULL_54_36b]